MSSLGIILLLAHTVDFISASYSETVDCISLEQLCLKDPQCETSYNVFKNCSGTDFLDSVGSAKCKTAAEVLSKKKLMICKCIRKMEKEEFCLYIYWSLRPSYVNGYFASYDSPYIDEERDFKGISKYAKHADTTKERSIFKRILSQEAPRPGMGQSTKFISLNTKGLNIPEKRGSLLRELWRERVQIAFLQETHFETEPGRFIESKNPCAKEASICNDNNKCARLKNSYAKYCKVSDQGSCDQHTCHSNLRQFFTRVPTEFTKRLLFCPCNQDSNCAERRRNNIVPKCSFEGMNKKNCLELYDECISDNLCKSRLIDYQKNCHLFDKKTNLCPSERFSYCIHSYMGMIGTVMTPNFINNSTMETSLWCTCEGSANREEECKIIHAMFTSNNCLKSALKHNLEINVDEEFPKPSDDNPDTSVFFSTLNQVPGIIGVKVLPSEQQMPGNTASGVSSPSLAITLLNLALFLWFLKAM